MQEWLAWQFLPLIRVWRRVQCIVGQHRYGPRGSYMKIHRGEEGSGLYNISLCVDCRHAEMEFRSNEGSEKCWRLDKHGNRIPMFDRRGRLVS